MKRLLFYLWLEIKKGMKFIPFFLAGILFTAAAVILAAAAFSAANGGEQVLPKATAAIVIDSDGSDETRTEAGQADLKTNLALGLVSGMPSVKSVCEFVFMSPKEAADGLQEGTVDAAVYLPQNVYEDINTGINTPVLIRVSGKYTSFTGGMFEELVRSGVSYIRSVEGSIYAVDSLSRSYPVVDTLAAAREFEHVASVLSDVERFKFRIGTDRRVVLEFLEEPPEQAVLHAVPETGETGHGVFEGRGENLPVNF